MISCCPELSAARICKGGDTITVKSGFVAVTGLPNAGKSTLINALMGERLLITSEKSQTTRRQVRCILTEDDFQMIFVDTPGQHQPKNKLGDFMLREIFNSVANSDVILYILDATRPQLDLTNICTQGKPVILILNKIDLLTPEQADALSESFQSDERFNQVIGVSALSRKNLGQVIEVVKGYLPGTGLLYPPDQLMDCDYRLLASELIREQALLHLEDEVPHGIAVEIVDFSETDDQATIAANIIVERESHKGIVIGKGGSMLKVIGTGARMELQSLLDKTVHLKLWVKVKKNWRKDPNQLKWLGYK